MNPLWLKVLLMLVMILITLFAGLVPIRVLKFLRRNAALASTEPEHRSVSLALCLLTCFSGGVFLATCFLDLLPDVNEHLREIKQKLEIDSDYPFAELLSCLGFFLVFGLEEIVLKLLPGHGHSHNPNSSKAPCDQAATSFIFSPQHLHVQRSMDNLHHDTPNGFNAYQSDAKTVRSADGKVSPLLSNGRQDHEDKLSKVPLHNQKFSSPPSATIGNGNSIVANRRMATENDQSKASKDCDLEEMLISEDRERFSQHRYSMVVGDLCSDEQCIGKHDFNGTSIYCSKDTKLHSMLKLAEPESCQNIFEGNNEDPPILMTSQPHAHSHGIRSITFVLALSFHSVLEGLAFGVQKESTEIMTLFLSLIIHKAIVAFSVGLQLARTHAHQLHWVTMSILLLALMTPIGAGLGMFVQESDFNVNVKDIMVLVFEGLAVGTFLYVTFFEVLQHERENEHPNLLKLLVIMISFSLIACFRLMKHGSHNEEGHSHPDELNLLLNSTAESMS